VRRESRQTGFRFLEHGACSSKKPEQDNNNQADEGGEARRNAAIQGALTRAALGATLA
jgi:hypothetical protein